MRTVLLFCILLFSISTYAQTIVTGNVVNQNGEPVPGANVIITGTAAGTVSDFDGNFELNTTQKPPFQITISSIGYTSTTSQVTTNKQQLNIQLQEEATQLGEIVVSASRTPERIFESPVSVERFGLKDIKSTTAPEFYDGLENLKGVDINTNSLTFKSINTRGFATFANNRFMQLVDGMDNSSPALNFVLGNLLGITELDVNSIELLPGASSALYGANAFNGILFMTSKNPFDHEGVSAYAKTGITSQKAAGDNPYYDFGIRLSKKFSDKLAGKANFSYLKGTDWQAIDEQDLENFGRTRAHYGYDGLNVYGDEVAVNLRAAGGGLGILPNENVSRTGYLESTLTNYNAESIKADFALHYRPFADDFEIAYVGKFGKGSTIYQGANRYAIKDFFLQQHKIEFKNDNFFVRGYVTDEDAGNSYDMRFTAINVNRLWKSDKQWFKDYIETYAGATLSGFTSDAAHVAARQAADAGRLLPGTPEFEQALKQVTSNPDLASGSQFRDGSQLYHIDANYNFSHLTNDAVDVQVGGSFREYKLNSFGTIYTDGNGPIRYKEWGAYTQLQKKLADDRLKLTGSVRYDKSELFDGNFSPRLSLSYTAGEKRNHNIRASIQTGFRNPTTQDLYIGLDAGRAILVGSANNNLDRDIRTFSVTEEGQPYVGGATTVDIVGRAAYENAFTLNSVQKGAPVKASVDLVKPEKVTAAEVGYRGQIDKFTIDLVGYYNAYKNFISNETVIVPLYGQVGDNTLSLLALQNGDYKAYQTYTNTSAKVNSYGGSLGVSTSFKGFDISANYTYAKQDFNQEANPDFKTNFNTPEHKFKAAFGNNNLFENFGFNINFRWSDEYNWQATFGDGVIPSYTTLDAQVNYRVPTLKSTFKAGATNIGGKEYFQAIGTGHIGSMYYISWIINNL